MVRVSVKFIWLNLMVFSHYVTLHSNHMGVIKTHLLMKKSVYLVNMNTNFEQTVKLCSACLDYQYTQHMKQCYTMTYHANPGRQLVLMHS